MSTSNVRWSEPKTVRIPRLNNPIRVDKYLSEHESLGVTRSQLQKAFKADKVKIAGKPIRPSHKLYGGEAIEVSLPEPEPQSVEPESIRLDIRFEDADVIVVNKPAGMVTHPAVGSRSGTLVNALLAYTSELSGKQGIERAGIVHRLDKDTTGLIIIARHSAAHLELQKQLQERTLKREYLALVCGHVTADDGEIDAPIGRSHRDRKKMAVTSVSSREARTYYALLERFSSYDLLRVQLDTGRTHQIRVHMAHIGHPVFGDPQYGGRDKWHRGQFAPERQFSRELLAAFPRQALHAAKLEFKHPTSRKLITVETEPPADFTAILSRLRERESR